MKVKFLVHTAIIAASFLAWGCGQSEQGSDQKKNTEVFEPKNGDILFQIGECGSFCEAIAAVTPSYNDLNFTHNALVYRDDDTSYVIEAVEEGVIKSSLHDFLNRHVTENGNPAVVAGRLKPEYNHLIHGALDYAHKQIGKPYNRGFEWNTDSAFYCSQLIYSSFHVSGDTLFSPAPMTFKKPGEEETFEGWHDYFKNLQTPVPEGVPGVNPGAMSLSKNIKIVHVYFEE